MNGLDHLCITMMSKVVAGGFMTCNITVDGTSSSNVASGKFDAPDAFDYLHNANVYAENTGSVTNLKGETTALYYLFITIGIIGLVCSLVWGGLRLSTVRAGNTREEVKNGILIKMVLGVFMFSAITWLTIFHKLVYGLL